MRALLVVALLGACSNTTGNDVPSTCPARVPSNGTACSGPLVCSYVGDAGERVTARCLDERWVVQIDAPGV